MKRLLLPGLALFFGLVAFYLHRNPGFTQSQCLLIPDDLNLLNRRGVNGQHQFIAQLIFCDFKIISEVSSGVVNPLISGGFNKCMSK